MPFKMGDTIHSVIIQGTMYIGGGGSKYDIDMRTVMKFDIHNEKWSTLPPHITKYFAMTSVADKLVLVGGLQRVPVPSEKKVNRLSITSDQDAQGHDEDVNEGNAEFLPTNKLAVFENEEWTYPYPPMKTTRDSSTAVSYDNHIIVAGGITYVEEVKGLRHTYSVEVLNVASETWYVAPPLPKPQALMKSTLIESTFFVVGGFEQDKIDPARMIYKVELQKLTGKIKLTFKARRNKSHWQEVTDSCESHSTLRLLEQMAPLNVEGSLVTVGGLDDKLNPSTLINLYHPDTKSWVKVGDLPTARYGCTCALLPTGEVIVVGGSAAGYLNAVDILSIR